MVYEIRVYFAWILSNAIFLIYSNIFKFESKWKKTLESLNLRSTWKKKNSMDYLNYLNEEASNFSLIFSTLILDILIEGDYGHEYFHEFYMQYAPITIRVLLIIGFMHNI
jgi:hypothetical protein